jgi:hypothetical protein
MMIKEQTKQNQPSPKDLIKAKIQASNNTKIIPSNAPKHTNDHKMELEKKRSEDSFDG